MRKAVVVLFALTLAAAACAQGGPEGAQTYGVSLDAASPEGEKIQLSAYFPGAVEVSPGDTVVFTNQSTEAPHTVTLGVQADRTNQPNLFLADGSENPVAFAPCYAEEGPARDLAECPSSDLPEFGGTGYWNSGLLQPAPAPDEAGPKEVTVEISDDIATGQYSFVCVLHPFMNGTVQVVEDSSDRETPEEVETTGEEAVQAALADAQEIEAPELVREGDTVSVAAGYGDQVAAINLYAPAEVEVEAGTTVQWIPRSRYEPHTVTFESPYQQPGDPASFAPGGVASGGEYTGGFANSGLIGPTGGPFPSDRYSLTFPQPGEYQYVCALHPGQTGVVRVTEAG